MIQKRTHLLGCTGRMCSAVCQLYSHFMIFQAVQQHTFDVEASLMGCSCARLEPMHCNVMPVRNDLMHCINHMAGYGWTNPLAPCQDFMKFVLDVPLVLGMNTESSPTRALFQPTNARKRNSPQNPEPGQGQTPVAYPPIVLPSQERKET